jgi:hypothetical protein
MNSLLRKGRKAASHHIITSLTGLMKPHLYKAFSGGKQLYVRFCFFSFPLVFAFLIKKYSAVSGHSNPARPRNRCRPRCFGVLAGVKLHTRTNSLSCSPFYPLFRRHSILENIRSFALFVNFDNGVFGTFIDCAARQKRLNQPFIVSERIIFEEFRGRLERIQ